MNIDAGIKKLDEMHIPNIVKQAVYFNELREIILAMKEPSENRKYWQEIVGSRFSEQDKRFEALDSSLNSHLSHYTKTLADMQGRIEALESRNTMHDISLKQSIINYIDDRLAKFSEKNFEGRLCNLEAKPEPKDECKHECVGDNKVVVEAWDENVEPCKECGVQWKKKGVQCAVCFHCEVGDIGRSDYLKKINQAYPKQEGQTLEEKVSQCINGVRQGTVPYLMAINYLCNLVRPHQSSNKISISRDRARSWLVGDLKDCELAIEINNALKESE